MIEVSTDFWIILFQFLAKEEDCFLEEQRPYKRLMQHTEKVHYLNGGLFQVYVLYVVRVVSLISGQNFMEHGRKVKSFLEKTDFPWNKRNFLYYPTMNELIILFQKESILITVIAIGITIEFITRSIKRRMKKSIFAQYDKSIDPKHAEYYLEYYRKSQIIDIIRVFSIIVVIGIGISIKTTGGVNLFVVAAGAFIIAFKDFLLSIIAFFFILPQHRIGDTIGIGDIQGQIIFIRMFSIGILGKDNDGDSTGKLFVIPSHKFLSEIIRKEDLHANSIKKELLRIPFKSQDFDLSFSEFLTKLEGFLDGLLPIFNRKNAGNYQTYIWHKYKMDIDYLEDKCIIISIGIVGKWEKTVEKKRKITEFVENQKKKRDIPLWIDQKPISEE